MTRNRLIPSLLLRNGRLVKGMRYGALRDAGSPHTTARAHNAQGADEIILLDILAAREGRAPAYEAIARVAEECFMPLTVGGGVTSAAIAQQCMAHGADKICVNTVALDRPALIEELAATFGRQAVVLGVDVIGTNGDRRLYDHRSGKALRDRGWDEWIRASVSRGAGEIRLMAVDCEGTRKGLDIELYKAARDLVDVPLILEGGAGTIDHLRDALIAGVEAIAMGAMLVFADNNIIQIKRHLANDKLAIRV